MNLVHRAWDCEGLGGSDVAGMTPQHWVKCAAELSVYLEKEMGLVFGRLWQFLDDFLRHLDEERITTLPVC